VAVLIPCRNEQAAIGQVVGAMRQSLPDAVIYVYDNNSSDRSVDVAREAGAIVRHETQQGKGHVVRRMFRDVEADYFLIVDGDDTYDPGIAPLMLTIAESGPNDLVNCVRDEANPEAYRTGHLWGNRMLTGVVQLIFGKRVQDMLSGYKLLSRRFVKSFPVLSHGFDIETELAIHALELSMPIAHVRGAYRGRQLGSESKLHTIRDGWRILRMIVKLARHERPFMFYALIAAILAVVSVALAPRYSSPTCRPVWCHDCRPLFCPQALCCSPH
jgi:glycosyltransferase involved in cell wall biosynthesis